MKTEAKVRAAHPQAYAWPYRLAGGGEAWCVRSDQTDQWKWLGQGMTEAEAWKDAARTMDFLAAADNLSRLGGETSQ